MLNKNMRYSPINPPPPHTHRSLVETVLLLFIAILAPLPSDIFSCFNHYINAGGGGIGSFSFSFFILLQGKVGTGIVNI